MRTRSLRVIAATAASGLVLAGCGESTGTGDGDAASAAESLSIVASTNVYGDIARAVAGDDADITSIIDSANQDPHEYEASAQDQLAVTDADVVVKNGGGFDPFLDTLLEASDGDPVVIDAVEVSGLLPGEAGDEHAHEDAEEEAHEHESEGAGEEHAEEEHGDGEEGHEHIEGFNEHVWYSFEAVEHVADEIAHELGGLDPDNAATYDENAAAFIAQVHALEERAAEVRTSAEGQGAAITEPVPVYLLEEVGLEIRTPDEFSEAVEEGADVPASVLADTLDLFPAGEVSVLAYNEQTVDSVTEQVSAAAEAAGIPVVSFTETLPEGEDYLGWMTDNLDRLAEAIG